MSYNISLRDDPPPPCPECEQLRHDIERHVAIAAEQAGEIEEMRRDLSNLRDLLRRAQEQAFNWWGLQERIDAALKEQK